MQRLLRSVPSNYLTNLLGNLDIKQLDGILPVFQFGQVIEVDEKNNNTRIKVRVPSIDDIFYTNDKGQVVEELQGELPWCFSALGRLTETPDINSVVLVGLLNQMQPFNGRVWFTTIKELTSKDIFLNNKEDIVGTDAWKIIENLTNIYYSYFPCNKGEKFKDKKKQINYKVGLRGKSNNKLLFDKEETTLIQDEGKGTESKLVLSKIVQLKGKKFEILSTDSKLEHNPVFASPLFLYLDQILVSLNVIASILTVPGLVILPVPGMPIAPSPVLAAYIQNLSTLKTSLDKLKIDGKSNYIKIN